MLLPVLHPRNCLVRLANGGRIALVAALIPVRMRGVAAQGCVVSIELAGQVGIVTGAGRGIGRAVAQALAAAGMAVAVSARSQDQITETTSRIEQAGGRAIAVPCDVTDQDQVERMVA